MTYEITNIDLYHLYRNRARYILCHRGGRIVWPRTPIIVPPKIPPSLYDRWWSEAIDRLHWTPFQTCTDTVRNTFRASDKANQRVEDYIAVDGFDQSRLNAHDRQRLHDFIEEINAQRLGNVVPADRRADSIGPTIRSPGDDGGNVDRRGARTAPASDRIPVSRDAAKDWQEYSDCVD